jgi:chromosome segregation ATPase
LKGGVDMADGQELLLTFGYDRKSLEKKVSEMEQVVEDAKMAPNISSEMKSELDKTLKAIKSFAKNASKDFAKIEAVNLDSQAFDKYVKKTDSRLNNLEKAVSGLIDKLAQIDGSTDLSKLGVQFEELKGVINSTTGAVGELVETANSVGANLKIVDAVESDFDGLIDKTEKTIQRFQKIQDRTKETKLTQVINA